MEGWIKLHKKILDHWIFSDAKHLKWWLIILMKVNFRPLKFTVGFDVFECREGQSFRSIEGWSELFGTSKKTTIAYFLMLQKDGMIYREIIGKGNRRKHLLTVVKWSTYQILETEVETEKDTENDTENDTEMYPLKKKDKKDKKNKSNMSEKSDDYKVSFESFRKLFPGVKRGFEIEYQNFTKKNKPETSLLLLSALEKEIRYKESLKLKNGFCPEWKNLSTWVNQKCWTQELPDVENKLTDNDRPWMTYKQMMAVVTPSFGTDNFEMRKSSEGNLWRLKQTEKTV
jgi:hypothetical protein